MSIDHSKVAKFFTDDIKPQIEGSNFENDTMKRFALVLEEQIHEMKYMWFNKETIEFFTSKCDCNF